MGLLVHVLCTRRYTKESVETAERLTVAPITVITQHLTVIAGYANDGIVVVTELLCRVDILRKPAVQIFNLCSIPASVLCTTADLDEQVETPK